MRAGLLLWFGRGLLGATALLGLLAAPALAAGGDVIHMHLPTMAKVHQQYSITLNGHAAATEKLYVFIDFNTCGATPAVEHKRANGQISTVDGPFSVVTKWHSAHAAMLHACAYLVDGSEPKNPSTGVLAHKYGRFSVSG